jgi:hypothetical protein
MIMLRSGIKPDDVVRITGFPPEAIAYLARPEEAEEEPSSTPQPATQASPPADPPLPHRSRRGRIIATIIAICGLEAALVNTHQALTALVIAGLLITGATTALALHRTKRRCAQNGRR